MVGTAVATSVLLMGYIKPLMVHDGSHDITHDCYECRWESMTCTHICINHICVLITCCTYRDIADGWDNQTVETFFGVSH